MKFFNGWYFPDTEQHFIEFMTKRNVKNYQQETRFSSFEYLDSCRVAIDIGANVGLWARDICQKFQHCHLFEPYDKNIECLKKNLSVYDNYTIHEYALSNIDGIGDLYFDESCLGGSSLNPNSFLNLLNKKVKKKKLDEFALKNVDYIKIDVQFHELEVIEGSIETLKINSPIICVEAARRNVEELNYVKKFLKILEELNYKIVGGLGKELFLKK